MGNGRITKICIICHNSFVAAHKDTLYCSQKCKLKQYDINKGINQNKVEWLDLRERILERDNYTCQKCGYFSMTTGMEVHHVKMLSRGGENKPNNMITLCGKCHSHAHNIPAD
jgi:ribosomal protein S27AE